MVLHAFISLKDSSLFQFGKNSFNARERIKSLTYLKRMVVKGHLGGIVGTMLGGIIFIF